MLLGMGKQNQQRRAAKKRRRDQESAGRRPPGVRRGPIPSSGGLGEPRLEDLVWAAVGAVRARTPLAEIALDQLAAFGRSAVAVAWRLLENAVADLRNRGWSAEDLCHVTSRRLSVTHARVTEGRWPPETGVRDSLRLVVELLALVALLPEVPPVGGRPDGPDAASDGLDARILVRVRALLNKAESTEFSEEAEALTAKAQELIARHTIDAVLLRRGENPGQPSSRRVYLDDPYSDAKAMLLDRVAQANRCSAVYTPAFGWSTVFGYDADLDAVELLTASLLAQAAHELARQGSRVDLAGRSRTRSFRRSFLLGFADRIGQRLSDVNQAQVVAAGAADGRLLPVLVARDQRVKDAQAAAYPRLTARPTAVSNGSGWVAGQAAADLADLSGAAGVLKR